MISTTRADRSFFVDLYSIEYYFLILPETGSFTLQCILRVHTALNAEAWRLPNSLAAAAAAADGHVVSDGA